MTRILTCSFVVALLLAHAAYAQEYRVEKLSNGAPADELSPEVAKLLAPMGYKVVRGESRVVLELWPLKQWPLKSPMVTDTILYPFAPGQLVGVIRLPRKINDFRQQEIASGVYTVRYGQQPVDGAHVGTSPTRDFALLLPAAEDKSPETIADYKALTKASTTAAGTNHPAILLLPRSADIDKGDFMGVRHDEEKDWWVLKFSGTARVAGPGGLGAGSMRVEMVFEGHAAE